MLSKSRTKYIQSLQHKKFRDEWGVFIAEGPKVVLDLLSAEEFNCKEIFAEREWLDENSGFFKSYADTNFEAIDGFELEKISALATPNQVLAVFEQQRSLSPVDPSGKITLVLDTIQDPGNMGTIIRIADWFAVPQIVCSTGCADMYNPKVVQSTMGSLGRVKICYTNITEWMEEHGSARIYGAALDGKDVRSLQNIEEGIIVIGNESKGISDAVMELVNEKITIAKKGRAESLNAAVAAGIILSHIG
jgi:TrmH family RNA methyltransferase